MHIISGITEPEISLNTPLNIILNMKTVTINKQKNSSEAKRAKVPDDIIKQLEASLKDIKEGRIRKAVH